MHLRKLILFIFFYTAYILCYSQQNNVWYFGRKAGLNFNFVPNQPLPSVLDNSQMIASEGCSSIADSTGKLLFYTNGVTVYNRQHVVMFNGDNLAANKSATQSSIIIPVPGNSNIYYIFTTDAVENTFNNGYNYSIVDMNLDNGNGGVVTKNVLLWPSCTERLTAARHHNGVDIWIITNDKNSNIFRAWLMTCNGLNTNPVVSTTGEVLNMHYYTNTGVIKVSPDGKQLCQTHFPFFDEIMSIPNFFQLFDFDNATGILSNARSIQIPGARYTHCEYSSDSKLLYLTRPNEKAIDQFEASLTSPAAIRTSRITFNTTGQFYGIQMAPDEKIYIAKSSSMLGVINKPNIKGTGCDFRENQIDLMVSSQLGLPSMVNDFSDPYNGFNYSIIDSCSGTVQFLGQTAMQGVLQWHWDFGDGTTSTNQNPIHQFPSPTQLYIVRLKITSTILCGNTIQKIRNIVPGGTITKVNFEIVNRCDSGYVRFLNLTPDAVNLAGQYIWYFGDGNTSQLADPIHVYNQPGDYYVTLKFNSQLICFADSMVQKVKVSELRITVSPEKTIVVGQSVPIFASGPAVNFHWTPATGLNNPNISHPIASPIEDIVYKITAIDKDGCKTLDSVKITVLQFDDFYVPTAFSPNNDGKNDNIKPFYGGKFTLLEFSIFNRWGQRIFTTSKRGDAWDGRINNLSQPSGVYVWIIRATDNNGKPVKRKGSFVLIR